MANTPQQSSRGVRSRIEILLVEDNPGDVRLTREALAGAKFPTLLTVAKDGVEAMELLHRRADSTETPLPDVILLDLNLPKKDGREVLSEIKGDERLKRIPIVMLTTSAAEGDILMSYNLGANCYVTKPVDLDEFVGAVKSIEDFWLKVVKLPSQSFSNFEAR
ncbi:MAG TPA: response regulator [Gemmatimonadaceae bacterium]|nr:response regulator [Gemmatimonadaceae bacterium]